MTKRPMSKVAKAYRTDVLMSLVAIYDRLDARKRALIGDTFTITPADDRFMQEDRRGQVCAWNCAVRLLEMRAGRTL